MVLRLMSMRPPSLDEEFDVHVNVDRLENINVDLGLQADVCLEVDEDIDEVGLTVDVGLEPD